MFLAAASRTDQILSEGDADDVVEALAEHRDAAVTGLDGPLEHRPGLGRSLYRDDVGPRHHDLSDDRVTELDDRVDKHPLVAFDRLVQGCDVGEGQQLRLGHVRLGLGSPRPPGVMRRASR